MRIVTIIRSGSVLGFKTVLTHWGMITIMTTETNLTATFIFSGYSDYWGGYHDRGRGGGCAFASYGKNTTLKDIVDEWVEDSWSNDYDFEDCPESVTSDDIRDCILAMLTDAGRADYDSGAVSEFSADWMSINDIDPESEDDDDDLCNELPQCIVHIDWSDHPDYNRKED
jgi:hypothetical protein